MFRRQQHISAAHASQPHIRYLYWGFTGAGFSRSKKDHTNANECANARRSPAISERLEWPLHTLEDNQEHHQPTEKASGFVLPDVVSIEESIARLTAERDSARSERELEADYREALGRTVEMLRKQLEEAQRKIQEVEAQKAEAASSREQELERELALANSRIKELEAALNAQLEVPSSLSAAPNKVQDEMMDIFLQFVGSNERPDDARL